VNSKNDERNLNRNVCCCQDFFPPNQKPARKQGRKYSRWIIPSLLTRGLLAVQNKRHRIRRKSVWFDAFCFAEISANIFY